MSASTKSKLRLPRRFSTHLGQLGARYRIHYEALQEQLGPFTTVLQREAAADAAQCHVIKLQAVEAWQTATEARTSGRGRRPSLSQIIKLQKRVALESSSYTLAFNRLTELMGPSRTPPSARDALVAKYS